MSTAPESDKVPALKPSVNFDKVVDAIEKLLRFTCILRDQTDYPAERYSERKASFTQQDQLQ